MAARARVSRYGTIKRMLLYVGRLAKEKNTQLLFEAFDLLEQRRPGDFHLLSDRRWPAGE